MVEGAGNKISKVGCGEGFIGVELKRTGKAKERLDEVIVGDIQAISLPYPDRYFDYTIFGDVPERLSANGVP